MKKIIDLPDDWEQQLSSMSDSEIVEKLYNIIRNADEVDTEIRTPVIYATENVAREIRKEWFRAIGSNSYLYWD